mgnify:CR=1 FL=1
MVYESMDSENRPLVKKLWSQFKNSYVCAARYALMQACSRLLDRPEAGMQLFRCSTDLVQACRGAVCSNLMLDVCVKMQGCVKRDFSLLDSFAAVTAEMQHVVYSFTRIIPALGRGGALFAGGMGRFASAFSRAAHYPRGRIRTNRVRPIAAQRDLLQKEAYIRNDHAYVHDCTFDVATWTHMYAAGRCISAHAYAVSRCQFGEFKLYIYIYMYLRVNIY